MNSNVPYSRVDRWIHRLAFHNSLLREMLADGERKLQPKWADYRAERPIFITSLPRAGTTIILEAMHRLPGLASHTYRDMPFVLTPVLWDKLSSKFRRQSALKERAHGDGLAVNEDSPEAFEEVLWCEHFRQKYSGDRIALWSANDSDSEFRQFFFEHMKKIISLRQPSHVVDGRYLSKNNSNIARLELLPTLFPDARILVPVRDPFEHVISMHRQHCNFKHQHGRDSFSQAYMSDIGHFEFGAMHKPFDFPNLGALIEGLSPESVDYWLAYWIAAFEHLATLDSAEFVRYEALCVAGVEGLQRICTYLGVVADDEALQAAAGVFRPPPPPRAESVDFRSDLRERALVAWRGVLSRCPQG